MQAKVLLSLLLGGLLIIHSALPARSQGSAISPGDISVVVGYPPGGGADIITRYFANKLKEKAGRNVLVLNKTGASGNLASADVARARPDGHTLLLATGTATTQYLFKNLGYDPEKDLVNVATLLSGAYVLIVKADLSVGSVQELIAHIKKKGSSFYGASNPATIAASEAFKKLANIEAIRVDYRATAEAINELKSGTIDFMFADPPVAVGQGRAGQVKLLAVTSAERMGWGPNLQTVQEAGIRNFDYTSWMAIYAPANTPKAIVAQLNEWFDEIVRSDDTRKFLANIGCDPLSVRLSELDKFHDSERVKWTAALKEAKVEPQ